MSKRSIDDILGDMENEKSAEGSGPAKTSVKFKKKKKKHWKRRIVLALIALFLITGGVLGVKAYTLAQKIFQGGNGVPGLLGLFSQGQLKGEADGRVNILLLGDGGAGHDGPLLTDTMMVLSINTKTNEVAMLSVPRDLYVQIGDYNKGKINSANALGEQYHYPGGGPALSEATVSKVLGIPINYYVLADFSGFRKIIDTVGGVDINVEKDLYDPYYPGGTYSVSKGMHHMDGAAALKYARSRETTSDFDRAKRQQKVLLATRDKVMNTSTLLNPSKMNDILNALGDHIRTDMQMWEALRAFDMIKKVDQGKIINLVLDDSPDNVLRASNIGGAYVLLPKAGDEDYSDIQNIAKNIFTIGPLKVEAAKIEILNASGGSGQAKKAADSLSGLGFTIGNVANASNVSQNTVIYDHTNGAKPNTIKYLEDKFCVKSTQQPANGSNYDITIMVGQDQLNKN